MWVGYNFMFNVHIINACKVTLPTTTTLITTITEGNQQQPHICER